MRNLSKLLSLALALVMTMTFSFTVAFANETAGDGGEDNSETIGNFLEANITTANDNGIVSTDTWLMRNLTTKAPSDDAQGYTVKGVTVYLKKNITEDELIHHIDSYANNAKLTDNMNKLTDGFAIGADTSGATAMLEGFSPIISLVLGIIVTLITIGMTVFSAFDIAYIAFPVFRNKCEDAKQNGSGAMVKTTGNGGTKLRFVTDEAQQAVNEGSVESGKSPWGIYFKKRVMSYILLAIILFILMTGNITLITNIAIRVVGGIMNVLGGLA